VKKKIKNEAGIPLINQNVIQRRKLRILETTYVT